MEEVEHLLLLASIIAIIFLKVVIFEPNTL